MISGEGPLLVVPPGIVEVTRFLRPYRDETQSWYGPVVREDDFVIRITVWGSVLTFMKGRDTIIRRHQITTNGGTA